LGCLHTFFGSRPQGGTMKILEINSEHYVKKGNWSGYEGFLIKTDKDVYSVMIDNDQNCCENWGYLSSEDDIDRYIGADLISVEIVDKALNTKVIDELELYEDYTNMIFVNFNTSEGLFQVVAYNEHDGYYAHEVFVSKNSDMILEEYL